MKSFNSNGFVWWNEEEIEKRESLARELVTSVRKTLYDMNAAIQMFRVETPCLMPQEWAKGHLPFYLVDNRFALRGESTRGTYEVMNGLSAKLPVCLYQINKSFRDEKTKAIRLSNYRLREFWQIEFQLFYSPDTKADYHQLFVDSFHGFGKSVELPENDLPPYSVRTTDLEIDGTEIASLSTRKDFRVPVFEMSFGLDRLVMKAGEK